MAAAGAAVERKDTDLAAAVQGSEDEVDLKAVVAAMMKTDGSGVEVKDRSYRFRTYKRVFLGKDAVAWLIRNKHAEDENQAVAVGDLMMAAGLLNHATRDHMFKNAGLFYRFAAHEEFKGSTAKKQDGSAVSWGDLIEAPMPEVQRGDGSLQPNVKVAADRPVADERPDIGVWPLDKHNVSLLDHVHPRRWISPNDNAKAKYNMVVLGAGAGGLVTAAAAAGVGARVALVEQHLLGGDCLNIGCVPSKALLKSAKVASMCRHAADYGVKIEGKVSVDFGAVMERMRKLRAEIAPNDSAERFAKLGVDVFIGRGQFTGKNTLSVNGVELTFSRACIATGGRAAVPPIPGLVDEDGKPAVPYLTNASVFNLTVLPARLAVIGAGPIGCELAQAFARFGSKVTVFLRDDGILKKEDPDAAKIVRKQMEADGVRFVEWTKTKKIRKVREAKQADDGTEQLPIIAIEYAQTGGRGKPEGKTVSEEFDGLLLAAGRAPNVTNCGFEKAGVEFDRRTGVKVNNYLQTTAGHIYAVGDCCTKYQFTHAADFMARIVVRNALFFGHDKFDKLLLPWATYTEPEIAHVGLYEADLRERGLAFDAYSREFADVDRAIVDSATDGYVKVFTKKGSDEILGATIVGAGAGDMISELTLAIQSGTGLGTLARVIHPYPTMAEAVRQCGDAYNKTRLTKTVKGIFRRLMSAQR